MVWGSTSSSGGSAPPPLKVRVNPAASAAANKVHIRLPQTPVPPPPTAKEAVRKQDPPPSSRERKSKCGVVVKQCEICGTQFRSAKSHKRHMDQCHVANGPRHVCCLCQRAFKRSDNLSAHYREAAGAAAQST